MLSKVNTARMRTEVDGVMFPDLREKEALCSDNC